MCTKRPDLDPTPHTHTHSHSCASLFLLCFRLLFSAVADTAALQSYQDICISTEWQSGQGTSPKALSWGFKRNSRKLAVHFSRNISNTFTKSSLLLSSSSSFQLIFCRGQLSSWASFRNEQTEYLQLESYRRWPHFQTETENIFSLMESNRNINEGNGNTYLCFYFETIIKIEIPTYK